MQVLFKAKALQTEKEITQMPAMKENIKTSSILSESDLNKTERGPNIFTDAAWKCNVLPLKAGLIHKEKSGIGIYID